MGYPMTFQRVLNRNGLATGGYGAESPSEFRVPPDYENDPAIWRTLAENAYKRLNERIHQRNLILGDLRRLETDTVDEAATAHHIAITTGIDSETVAIVLKEFMGW